MNLSILTVDDLASHCAGDTQKFYRQQSYDPQFCFELLRRALAEEQAEAFSRVYQIYQSQVQNWVYHHPRFIQTSENADYFASFALPNFYFALRGTKFAQFAALSQIMAYLKLCVHTSIAQYLRTQSVARLADLEEAHWIGDNDYIDSDMNTTDLWFRICELLPDAKDRLLAHIVFVQDLKPAEIVDRYPQHWHTPREVSVALQRIRRILRGDSELQQWAKV